MGLHVSPGPCAAAKRISGARVSYTDGRIVSNGVIQRVACLLPVLLHALPPDMSGRGWKTYMAEPAAIPNHSINPGNAR